MAFMSLVAACHTRTGSLSLPKCFAYAFQRAPLRACGDDAHSTSHAGMVAMPGLMALMISTSGSALASSVGK